MTDEARHAEIRNGMTAAVHGALKRLKAGDARHITEASLVSALCASALAPVAAAGLTSAPTALAAVGLVGGLGVTKLSEVIDSALDTLRGNGSATNEDEVRRQITEILEQRLPARNNAGEQLYAAASRLLEELGFAHELLLENLRMLNGQEERIGEAIFRVEASLGSRIDAIGRVVGADRGGAVDWSGCPYRGLRAYGPGDAQVFFGRRKRAEELVGELLKHSAAGKPLIVTGPSGVGKSSLLNAGLLPILAERTAVSGSRSWPWRRMTPGAYPLRNLAIELAQVTGQPAQAVRDTLRLDPSGAADLVDEALMRTANGVDARLHGENVAQPRLVLIVDQFEELFTQASTEPESRAERECFIAALVALASVRRDRSLLSPGAAAAVVLAVRGDYFDRVLDVEPFADSGKSFSRVKTMTPAELELVICGPACEAGMTIEPRLVEEVLRDVSARADKVTLDSGVLPLVSQAMVRVWNLHENGRLTVRGYNRAGRISEAVDRDAAEILDQLSPAQRSMAREVFLRLTLVATDGRIVRRHGTRRELCQTIDADPRDVDRVVEAFAQRRLLVLEQDSVEIAHDVLLDAWETLRGWIDADRADHAVYGRLVTDAEDWQQHGRDHSYLYAGPRLEETATVRARWKSDPQRYPALPEAATEFLIAGQFAERAKKRRSRLASAVLATLSVLALTASVALGFSAHDADRETEVAVSRQLAADALELEPADPYTAGQLAAAAWRVSPTAQADQAELTLAEEQRGMLIAPDDEIDAVAFNPQGTLLAAAGADGAVRLWDPATETRVGDPIVATDGRPVITVAFNASGNLLATADDSGIVKVWNSRTHEQTGPTMLVSNALVSRMAFDPTASVLAVATDDGHLSFWNPSDGHQIGTSILATARAQAISDLVFTSDGKLLATSGDDGDVRYWDPSTGAEVGAVVTVGSPVYGSAFSPSGGMLATVGADGRVTMRDLTARTQVAESTDLYSATSDDSIEAMAVDPADATLAVAAQSGTVTMRDSSTLKQIGSTITAGTREDPVVALAFNPSGTLLATAGANGVVRLWDPSTGQPPGTAAVSASPDMADAVGVPLNSAGTRLPPATIKQITAEVSTATGGAVYDMALDPRGGALATVDREGNVKFWDPATRRQVGPTITAAVSNDAGTVTFNASGTLLATTGNLGSVSLWNPTTGRQVGSTIYAVADGLSIYQAQFNPSGTLLATAGDDGDIRLWNPSTQEQVGATMVADPYRNPVYAEAFDPSGTVLATSADNNDDVVFWDPASQQRIGTAIAVPDTNDIDTITAMAFSSDGDHLVITTNEGNSVVMDTAWTVNPRSALCSEFGMPSGPEWSQYVGSAIAEPTGC